MDNISKMDSEQMASIDVKIMKKHIRQLSKEQLISLFMTYLRPKEEKTRIPVSIFSARLSSLELAVKYLKEELQYSNKKIALSLLRSPQNIWITYRNAKSKYPKPLKIRDSAYDIPIDVLADKKLSILETIVKYLRDTGKLKYREIAKILHRNVKTITTAYYRAKKRL